MADVKREVRALGQKITGLKAGDNVTLVLKKPKPKVDATPAKRANQLAGEKLHQAQEALGQLSRARSLAASGDVAGARKLVDGARQALDAIKRETPRAKEWAQAMADDANGAPSEVKDGYGAAKDGADLSVGHLEKAAEGLERALRAVGAFVEEMAHRA
jgi:hypothetical protein